MKTLAIVGLGLMGGSLGLAVRRRGLAGQVRGYARRAEMRDLAVGKGVVDVAFATPQEAVAGADLAVFCLPVFVIADLVKACGPSFAPGCVVTDVGSTKAELARELDGALHDTPATFVGSHPIAGSEEAGLGAARPDLYEGAIVAVTPGTAGGGDETVERVSSFWRSVGGRVVVMAPRGHDELLARTSHLPHVVASLLVAAVFEGRDEDVADFCGTGFRDTTRIAAGSEKIWHDIVKSNRGPISRELGRLRDLLEYVKGMVDQGDFDGVRRFFAESRRRRLVIERPSDGASRPECGGETRDRQGGRRE